MSKKAAALAALLALGVAVPAAQATYALSTELLAFIASVPPTNSFAVGEGKFAKGQPGDQFTFSAHGPGMGTYGARGSVRFRTTLFGTLRGSVDCLVVAGNQAGISGRLDEPPDPQVPRFVLAVEDNGEPGGELPDRATVAIGTASQVEADCGLAFLEAPLGDPIVQGNIVVKDRT